MFTSKRLLAAMMMLVGLTNAKVYNVVMSYGLEDGVEECSGDDAERLEAITTEAIRRAGLNLAGNSNNWKFLKEKEYNGNGADNGKKEGWRRTDGGERALAQEERELGGGGGCGGFCYFMCQSTGQDRWCGCCACCGNGRRLRVMETVTLTEVEDAAALEGWKLLAEAEPISCLERPYDIITLVEESQEKN